MHMFLLLPNMEIFFHGRSYCSSRSLIDTSYTISIHVFGVIFVSPKCKKPIVSAGCETPTLEIDYYHYSITWFGPPKQELLPTPMLAILQLQFLFLLNFMWIVATV